MSKTPKQIFSHLITKSGQRCTKDLLVLCGNCRDSKRLVDIKSDGWVDAYRNGFYVHFECLSKQRVAELKVAENYETIKIYNDQKLEGKRNALILSNAG
jgi:hypothetical protein